MRFKENLQKSQMSSTSSAWGRSGKERDIVGCCYKDKQENRALRVRRLVKGMNILCIISRVEKPHTVMAHGTTGAHKYLVVPLRSEANRDGRCCCCCCCFLCHNLNMTPSWRVGMFTYVCLCVKLRGLKKDFSVCPYLPSSAWLWSSSYAARYMNDAVHSTIVLLKSLFIINSKEKKTWGAWGEVSLTDIGLTYSEPG